MTSREASELICELGRRLYARNLIAAADGNLSYRQADGTFLITRSGISKGFMTPADVLVAGADGSKISGEGKVSSEFYTHLASYEERPDIRAVIHAHTPVATALTLAGVSLMEPVLPEIVAGLGAVPTCNYATPGTREGADVVRPHIRHHDCVLLDRHGALTVGSDLMDAYFKMERLEHAALTLWHARALGPLPVLTEAQVSRVHAAARAYRQG